MAELTTDLLGGSDERLGLQGRQRDLPDGKVGLGGGLGGGGRRVVQVDGGGEGVVLG